MATIKNKSSQHVFFWAPFREGAKPKENINKIKTAFKIMVLVLSVSIVTAQIKVVPLANTGSGYPSIINAGLDVENPDCVHENFGPHITLQVDTLLKKPVFAFHSHIKEDNDRCEVFDRVRMEIKGGPGTNAEAQHLINTSSYYRWKFFIPSSYQGSTDFCHIFQNKINGGDDTSLPLLTFTLRTSALQLIHSGGSTGASSGVLAQVPLSALKGKWIEAYMYQVHGVAGKVELKLVSLQDKKVLLNYKKDNLLLWRNGAGYSRPKWGIYRLKNNISKDETILFSDFCISESKPELCPSDIVAIDSTSADTLSSFYPENKSTNIVTSPTLQWSASENAKGNIFFGESSTNLQKIGSVSENFFKLANLKLNTTYYWSVELNKENGSTAKSPILSFTTGDTSKISSSKWLVYAANNLPHVESAPWMELNTRPATPLRDEVFTDPMLPKNKLYAFHFDGTTNFRYRYRNSPQDTAVTIVMRTKALNKDVQSFNYLEIRNKGWREKMRLNQSTLKIERSVTDIERKWNNSTVENFQVIRMTLKGQVCKVYLDENPEPFIVGKTETTDANTYIEWGKSATQEVGGIVDYITIYPNIESSPNSLPAFPDSLVLSSDAKLRAITLNGTTLGDFSPSKLDYVINANNEDPIFDVAAFASNRHANITVTKPSGTQDSIWYFDVTANDKFNKTRYSVKIKKLSTGVNDLYSDADYKIFPNPSSDIFNIHFDKDIKGQLEVYNEMGQKQFIQELSKDVQVNLSSSPTGLYYFYFRPEAGGNWSKAVIKL
jgi:hypothetical protein